MAVASPFPIKKGNSANCDTDCKQKQRDEADKRSHIKIIRKPKNGTTEA